ncbi:HAD family hydrolase [Leifsonia sp. ZF2019]|uniref:HAD family hydrolase n=1 Tax=Leifsonia sp. ZF2019 TaxID=2781978 RepID=UPI001CC0B1A0|nr:HAD family hydrolase [Leifsonia sp. ZF2019]UAJ79007.1 HAD family hydrolase [Leifsonia sp. ZF2019]
MTTSTILFDVDGTLVDSNYLHVDAWQRAFDASGVQVDAWRIHRAIGQDSERLLNSLVGERDDDWVERASELHSRFYREQADRLRAFEAAGALLRALRERGLATVLATSAPDDELQLLRDTLAADDAVTATTSADDVDEAKPDPGILNVALDRVGASPEDAVMVGDSVWDMRAAGRAGIRAIGLRCGGSGAEELREAGASRVYDHPAELLRRVGEWV